MIILTNLETKMNKREEIESLQAKIAILKQEIARCPHDWNKPKYDPESFREPYGYRTVAQGSDVWGEPEGYRDATKDRWSRECKICGHKEFTYTQEVVSVDKQPKFL